VKEFYQGGVLDCVGDKTLYIQSETLKNMFLDLLYHSEHCFSYILLFIPYIYQNAI
jgi:hypothetical protein